MTDDKSKMYGLIAGIATIAGMGALSFYLASKGVVAGGGVSPPNPSKTGSLKVTVYDAKTSKPIQGATVTISNVKLMNVRAVVSSNALLNTQSATTDTNGVAVINNIPEGKYQMTVRAGGYQDYTTTVQVQAGYITPINVYLAVNPVNPPNLVNDFTVYLRWGGNAYPGLPTMGPLSFVDITITRPDKSIVAEGTTDSDGKFKFQYAFKTANQPEWLYIFVHESVFEPYLPFVLGPTHMAISPTYSSSNNQPPIYLKYDENNALYIDVAVTNKYSEVGIQWTSTWILGGEPYLRHYGTLPLLVTANGNGLSSYRYLPSTTFMFAKKVGGNHAFCGKAKYEIFGTSYPDYKNNPAPYDYIKYPYREKIDLYKASYWASSYPAIIPKKVMKDVTTLFVFEVEAYKVGKENETWDTFSCVFVSCVWSSKLSKNLFKILPVKSVDASVLAYPPIYTLVQEGSGLYSGLRISALGYHYNPEDAERSVVQYLYPQFYQWQVIRDDGVIK